MAGPVTLVNLDTLDTLTFDVCVRENYQPVVRTTDHPVEDGVDVTDHARREPTPFDVQTLITDSPFLQSAGGLAYEDRVQRGRDFLDAAVGHRLSVTTTRFGILTNILLIAWGHAVTGQEGVFFDLRLKEVRIASATTVEFPPEVMSSTAADTMSSSTDSGEQPTTDTAANPQQVAADMGVMTSWGVSLGL